MLLETMSGCGTVTAGHVPNYKNKNKNKNKDQIKFIWVSGGTLCASCGFRFLELEKC